MHMRDGWIEIRDAQGRLLCLYHPSRQLIEIKRRHEEPAIVDLTRYQEIIQPKSR